MFSHGLSIPTTAQAHFIPPAALKPPPPPPPPPTRTPPLYQPFPSSALTTGLAKAPTKVKDAHSARALKRSRAPLPTPKAKKRKGNYASSDDSEGSFKDSSSDHESESDSSSLDEGLGEGDSGEAAESKVEEGVSGGTKGALFGAEAAKTPEAAAPTSTKPERCSKCPVAAAGGDQGGALAASHTLCPRCGLCGACECGCHLEFELRHRFMSPLDATKLEANLASVLGPSLH
mmetsp:Transcript_5065/g.10685  ORF Transcript_5065/g.10685 Transcript_5065/m.10685 type:complete len:232 (-) Transcript_5065:130-825(-)